jgi:hypothetical protein
MYKVKLSPEEALETIKLRMKYDSSKTLNENVNLIQEQELEKDVEAVNKELGAFFSTDEQKVVDILKKYDTTPKFNEFLKKFQEITKKDLGSAFGNSFVPSSDKSEWKQLTDHLRKVRVNLKHQVDKGLNITKIGNEVAEGSKWYDAIDAWNNKRGNTFKARDDQYWSYEPGGDIWNFKKDGKFIYQYPNSSIVKGTWVGDGTNFKIKTEDGEQYDSQTGQWTKQTSNTSNASNPKSASTPSSIPAELKDVKDFQDWLDKNYPGWHDKYKTLGKDVAKGYGKFGPRTTKAWATYKDEYLKKTPTVTPTGNPDLEVDDKDASLDQPF